MAIKFKSLCSGSSGNSALLWTGKSSLLIDFAPGCQRDCRALLENIKKICGCPSAILVTHAHGDHINRNSLKILHEAGLKVHCHPAVCSQIKERHGDEYASILNQFENEIKIGDFKVRHIRVSHAPNYYTTAFSITVTRRSGEYKASIFTDLSCFTEEHVSFAADSDLLLLEANYDLKLLEKYGHYGSEFHMSNPQTAKFLHRICEFSKVQPQAVVLTHLSGECNDPHLPPQEITSFFRTKRFPVKFQLQVAKRYEAGKVIILK